MVEMELLNQVVATVGQLMVVAEVEEGFQLRFLLHLPILVQSLLAEEHQVLQLVLLGQSILLPLLRPLLTVKVLLLQLVMLLILLLNFQLFLMTPILMNTLIIMR